MPDNPEKFIVPEGFRLCRSLDGIDEYELVANGLHVLLLEDDSTPTATFQVTYRVGSRDEITGVTGAAHFLEHLLFKGSKNFPGNAFDQFENRGVVSNATTWLDRTNYFELTPSRHLPEIIAFEADRTRDSYLRAEDLRVEMTVVRNEFERGENDPREILDREIWAAAFQSHPYHHPTIGWREDIEGMTVEKLQSFYDTFYWPNNAVVCVVGNFDKLPVLRSVNKYFGVLSASPRPIPEIRAKEPPQRGERRVSLRREDSLNIVSIAYKGPAGTDSIMPACVMAVDILAGGRTSRLYRRLVDTGLAESIDGTVPLLADPGLIVFSAFLADGASHEKVEKLMTEEITRLAEKGPTREEYRLVLGEERASLRRRRDGSFSVASGLNEAIAAGDWTIFPRSFELMSKATPAKTKAAAELCFRADNRTVGFFIGDSKKGIKRNRREPVRESVLEIMPARKDGFTQGKIFTVRPPFSLPAIFFPSSGAGEIAAVSPQIHSTEPLAGVSLDAMKMNVPEVVTLVGSLPGGRRHADNPLVPDFLAELLPEGAPGLSKEYLSEELKRRGANIFFGVSSERFVFDLRCLKKDFGKIFSLLGKILTAPLLPPRALLELKKRSLAVIASRQSDTADIADSFLRRAIYPSGHPNYAFLPSEERRFLQEASLEDIKMFHKNIGRQGLKIAVVGDLPPNLSKIVEDGLSSLPADAAQEKEFFEPESPGPGRLFRNLSHKENVDCFLGGYVPIRLGEPEESPLRVALAVLGGGFTARLMQRLREKEGLTYGTEARLTGLSRKNGGHWFAYGSFAASLFERGLAALQREINEFIARGASVQETELKKEMLAGRHLVGLASTRGLAKAILRLRENDLPVSELDDWPERVKAVKVEEVNAAIERYLDSRKMIVSAAGPIARKMCREALA